MSAHNQQVILKSRPKEMISISDFALKQAAIPKAADGQVVIQSLYITVDPYLRDRMSGNALQIGLFELNEPINGAVIGKVVESKHPGFKSGDIVIGHLEWADYSMTEGENLSKLDPLQKPISTAVGILGMPGMTAYFGLLDIGKPKAGETVVVSAAAGAVGSAVGQMAKIKGCHVVGITGSDEKIAYLLKECGFDAAVNYKKKDYVEQLNKACSKGVDIYFDNVGGQVSDPLFNLLNLYARIPLCGQISQYNKSSSEMGPRILWPLLSKSALIKGFFVDDYKKQYPQAIREMAQWIKEGKLKYREQVVAGIENLPKAFVGLFKGENIGKQLVKIAD
jgi:NADPH:quinone reductase